MQPVLIRVQEHGIFKEENCTHAVASKHEIVYSGLYLQYNPEENHKHVQIRMTSTSDPSFL
jgi:hypothetical protein